MPCLLYTKIVLPRSKCGYSGCWWVRVVFGQHFRPEIPVKLFKFTCLGQFHHWIGRLLNTSHWSNEPCCFSNLGQIAKIHDVWTPGEIGGDVNRLVSFAPGILDNHLDQSCNEDYS